MKFGLMFANVGSYATAEGVVEIAVAAEDAGFESIWTVEHVIWPESYSSTYPYSPSGKMPGDRSSPIPDPLVWLSFAAAHTSTIRLATGILILPERNPLVLAKSVATLASLSNNRFDLGIGVGWLKEEFEALGIPFEGRGQRTDDYVAAMRQLWASDGATFDGEYAKFQDVSSNPKPPNGDVPIVVGGHTKAAARRAGRLGNGFFPGKGSIEELTELIDVVNQTAAENDRDASQIEMTAGHPELFGDDPVGACQELAAIGVTRTIVPAFGLMGGPASETAAAISEKILQPCADI